MKVFAAVSSCVIVLAIFGFAQEPAKVPFKLTADEQKLLDLTNAERKKEELEPLKPNPVLFQVARAHTVNMAKQEKLAHDLDCKTPFDRIKEANYDYQRAGENVALSSGAPTMADILKQWMDSEGHRANILKEDFTEIGLGIAKSETGDVYATQVFGKPFPKE